MEYYNDAQGRRSVVLKLNEKKDADVILRLSAEKKQTYIKRLIREDIDIDQIKKMRCCKCGGASKAYIKVKRFEAGDCLSLPLCQDCVNEWLKGFANG